MRASAARSAYDLAAARNARAFSHDPTVPVDFTDCSSDGPLVDAERARCSNLLPSLVSEYFMSTNPSGSEVKTLPPVLDVEESRAKRLQRQQARFRARGG